MADDSGIRAKLAEAYEKQFPPLVDKDDFVTATNMFKEWILQDDLVYVRDLELYRHLESNVNEDVEKATVLIDGLEVVSQISSDPDDPILDAFINSTGNTLREWVVDWDEAEGIDIRSNAMRLLTLIDSKFETNFMTEGPLGLQGDFDVQKIFRDHRDNGPPTYGAGGPKS